MLNVTMSLLSAMDLVSPLLVNHHRKVAYIAYYIGVELHLSLRERKDLLLAGVLHDIGAFSLQERIETLNFECEHPHNHAERGFKLLQDFKPLARVADIVRYHHVPWDAGRGERFKGGQVPQASHIIHLADRVAVLLPDQRLVLRQGEKISQEIQAQAGTKFRPELVEAFQRLAGKEYFWLDASSSVPTEHIRTVIDMDPVELDMETLKSFTEFFSKIIDFRSPFTATHSSSVAVSAEALARVIGFSQNERQMIRVAGYLHDLGKLAIPQEILEKPGKLSTEEWDVMRCHPYFGYRILQKIPFFDTINSWGSLHHERLDGSGYPFHLVGDQLPLGARIMAVADIFTALTEDRPYRAGMTLPAAMDVLGKMAKDGAVDKQIVGLLQSNLEEINNDRTITTAATYDYYQRMFKEKN